MTIVVELSWREVAWRFFRAAFAVSCSMLISFPMMLLLREIMRPPKVKGFEWVETVGDIICVAMLVISYVVVIIVLWRTKGETAADQINFANMLRKLKQKRLDEETLVSTLEGGDLEAPEEGEVCAICLEPKEGTVEGGFRILGCRHSFHAECVDKWWLDNGRDELTCPVCRYALPTGSK